MAVVRKKQDDKNLKILRELVTLSGNKQCFDCNQKGPTYVNMTIGSFVCTRCSGVLRGVTPPHRVKSISMTTFTTEEIEFIKSHGNDLCAKTWLGLWDPKRSHSQDHRELMIDKYERKRYYLEPASPLKSITNTAQLAPLQKQQQQTQLNNATLLTNGTAKSIEENKSDWWETNATTNGKTSTSRWKTDLLSSNDNSSLFNNHISAPVATNGHRSNGFTNNNNNGTITNGLSLNGNNTKDSIIKNGFHLPPPGSKIENNNLFTPDTDFVADFGSANIFDALNNKPSINNKNSTNKPILLPPGKTNGNHSNGVDLTNGNQTNGNNGFATNNGNKNDDVNFADFEHNTIYNAAAIENQNSNYFNSFSYNNNSVHSNNGTVNTQWSVWQQFPWPYIQPEQNRWSLPMSLSSTSNSLKSSGTFNSNSSINSTPSVDRYAALKDLDDQLREIKEKDNHNTLTTAVPAANPFNGLSTSPSTQPNPFQTTTSSPPWFNEQQGLQTPVQPMYQMTNGNGNINGNGNAMYDHSSAFGPNGSPFNGNGLHYPKVTDNIFNGSLNMTNGFPQKNPFAAPVLNTTTNPFL